MAWNYPYFQVARIAAPNLMLSDTIILIHTENCPRSALAIVPITHAAGCPPGACINLFAPHRQIETIIADPRIQGVSLTVSERAGRLLFGLVIVDYKVSSDDEAVTLTNNSDYGLGGAVFSPDGEQALAVAQQINTGMVEVKCSS